MRHTAVSPGEECQRKSVNPEGGPPVEHDRRDDERREQHDELHPGEGRDRREPEERRCERLPGVSSATTPA